MPSAKMMKNSLKMFYLIAHFIKNFQGGRPPAPPAVGRSGEGNQVVNGGGGKEIKLVASLYTPGGKRLEVEMLFRQLLILKLCLEKFPLVYLICMFVVIFVFS